MKGDFSRRTFDAARHYAAVTMQQGRVQLDADWNEQAEIARHRAQTETLDTVGRCGGPLHAAAFGVVLYANLTAAEKNAVKARWAKFKTDGTDFLLSPGRYYVDGILVENEELVPFGLQPDVLDAAALGTGDWLLYLDVWERHLTALEEPSVAAQKAGAAPLREIALGGPDTASRVRVVWQVRAVQVAKAECFPVSPEYQDKTAPTTGRVRIRAAAPQGSSDPCVVPAGSGYRGLENQLYRVEIHDGGQPVSHTGVAGQDVATWDVAQRTLTLDALGGIAVGGAVELYHATAADPAKGTVAYVTSVSGNTITVNAAFEAPDATLKPKVRPLQATCKWSRDNGVVLAKVRGIKSAEREVVVESFGVDDVLSIQVNQWVELFDDRHDLAGTPGQLCQVESRNDATRTLVLRTPPATLGGTGGVNPDLNPRIRRWDGLAAVKTDLPADYQELESGVQVQFLAGSYRTGEWWNAAARTATAESQSGTVEWPQGADGKPEARRPAGIVHHYCRLGVVKADRAGKVTPGEDCRCFFAPATELNSLEYVSGAGQEAMPDPSASGEFVKLGLPLIVGIPNAHCRDKPASVRFSVRKGGGIVSATPGGAGVAEVDVPLEADGMARCYWALKGDYNPLDNDTLHQLVEARLLENGVPVQLPVIFNASLSVAHQVSYDPGDCKGLAGQVTVQKAIDRLAQAVSLYSAGGDGQEARPGQTLPCPLHVLAASACGPAGRQPVRFQVEGGGKVGGVDNNGIAVTDSDGIAEVSWTLGTSGCQRVTAVLEMPDDRSVEPRSVVFNATLSTADEVAYTPNGECEMQGAGVETVQQALDWLCAHRGHGGCSVTVGEGGDYPTLAEALELLKTRNAVNVCLLPGAHPVRTPLALSRPGGSVKITGNGTATALLFEEEGRIIAGPLGELAIRDVLILTTSAPVVAATGCWDFTLEKCLAFLQEPHVEALVTVQQCLRTRIAGNLLWAPPPPQRVRQPGGAIRKVALKKEFVLSVREISEQPTLALDRLAMQPVEGRGGVLGMQSAHPTGAGLRTPATVGDVLALLDGNGTTHVKDNFLVGNVRLYGQGGALGVSQLNSDVLDRVRFGQLGLSHQGGALYLHANQLHRVLLDAGVLAITNPAEGQQPAVPFRLCSLSENAFFDSFSQVLAAQVNVGHNHWVQNVVGDLLVAAGELATVVGNGAVFSDGPRLWLAISGPVAAPPDSNTMFIQNVF
jgi:hypothetical protein